MIVLSRKKNESIVISGLGDREITVSVVEMRDDKVRLGIDAPKEIAVRRSEVHEALQCTTPTADSLDELRRELRKSRLETEHYRTLLAQWVAEPWQGVTVDQLQQEAAEGGNIDDILESLEKASAA